MQQVRRDRLRRGSRLTENARRLRVQPGTLARGQPAQHRVAHERVLELERAEVSQDPGPHQLLAERRGLRRGDAGQPRGRHERRPFEHRDGMREPDRPLAQARKRRAHRSRDRVRPQARHRLGVAVACAAMPRSRSPSASRWINSGLPPVAP